MTITEGAIPIVSDEREEVLLSLVAARAARDPEYRRNLATRPRQTLAEEGLLFPEHITVRVLEDTPLVRHEVRRLPERFPSRSVAAATATGQQTLIVEDSEELRHLVVPLVPDLPGPAPEVELRADNAVAGNGTIPSAESLLAIVVVVIV